MGVLPLSKYTFSKCHLSPAGNDPPIKWKQRMVMMMVILVMILVATIKMGSHLLTSYFCKTLYS